MNTKSLDHVGPISGKTNIVGVFGDPVSHTLSPPMHQAAFRALGLDWVYVPFHVKKDFLADAVAGIRALGLRGVNVTVPHKVEIMPYVDEVDEDARLIGAVNTIVNRDGCLVGYNTDGDGFVRSLQVENHDLKGKNILLLGAGGAALAIAAALARAGVSSMTIANRTVEKAAYVADKIAHLISDVQAIPLNEGKTAFKRAASEADIAVQCTSIGMFPHHKAPPIVSVDLFDPDTLLVDIVYTPKETAFLRQGMLRGCPVVTGEGMLAYQGAIAFELWTEREAPERVMLDTLNQLLAAR